MRSDAGIKQHMKNVNKNITTGTIFWLYLPVKSDVVGVLEPNGAGKTSMLKNLINGEGLTSDKTSTALIKPGFLKHNRGIF